MISQERLRQILHYDPGTGVFTWREAISKKVVVGRVAGSVNSDGYVVIGIYGRAYYAHRLAWLYMTGEMPPVGVDHDDTDTGNNIWTNLRLATKSQNGANRPAPVSNTSGHKGVSWHKGAGKWMAMIWCGGEVSYLGLFVELDDAAQAYETAAMRLFGEYGRVA